MLNNDRFIYRALKNIATRKKYIFETHSYGWIIEIRDAVRVFRVTGYTFDINPPSGVLMARDKYATYELVRFILPKGNVIPSAFIPCQWKEEFIGTTKQAIVQSFIEKFDFPLVLKDLRGAQGNEVFCIDNGKELEKYIEHFESMQCDALLAPYIVSDKELRIILLDEGVQLAYYKHGNNNWKFNLSQGAETTVIPEDEYHSIEIMAQQSRKIMKQLGLRFASCDFLITPNGSHKFLEVNGGVCVDRFIEQNPEYAEHLEKMYEAALEKSFIINS